MQADLSICRFDIEILYNGSLASLGTLYYTPYGVIGIPPLHLLIRSARIEYMYV